MVAASIVAGGIILILINYVGLQQRFQKGVVLLRNKWPEKRMYGVVVPVESYTILVEASWNKKGYLLPITVEGLSNYEPGNEISLTCVQRRITRDYRIISYPYQSHDQLTI